MHSYSNKCLCIIGGKCKLSPCECKKCPKKLQNMQSTCDPKSIYNPIKKSICDTYRPTSKESIQYASSLCISQHLLNNKCDSTLPDIDKCLDISSLNNYCGYHPSPPSPPPSPPSEKWMDQYNNKLYKIDPKNCKHGYWTTNNVECMCQNNGDCTFLDNSICTNNKCVPKCCGSCESDSSKNCIYNYNNKKYNCAPTKCVNKHIYNQKKS